jgi:hypothetical protein
VFTSEAMRALRFALVALSVASAGCVTVRPQQRAALADPIMQFEGDPQQAAAYRHALENREGAMGGAGVSGGGCGCN